MKKFNSTIVLLALYFLIRIFSFFFGPDTPLFEASYTNTAVSVLILIYTTYLLLNKDARGWYIIALEIILGGSGGYFAVAGLTLRTLLLAIALVVYFGQQIINKKIKDLLKETKPTYYFLLALFLISCLSALRGYLHHNSLDFIFSDTLPYLFFFYYFPLKELLKSYKFKQLATNAIMAMVIGNLIIIVGTFVAYSSGLAVLQGSYYHWYRDIALGKITNVGFNFFRLVLNEHLLMVPLILWSAYQIIHNINTKKFAWLGASLLIILSINLTRIYLLALLVGLLFLLSKTNWRRWFVTSLVGLFIFFTAFTSIHLLASRGKSLGWELFGIRLQSVIDPTIEPSALSRKLLLPKIVEVIKISPVLGRGLGSTITVYSPVFEKQITTPHFDWGYLEIIAEIGIIGFLIWVLLVAYIFSMLKKRSTPRFMIAAMVSLVVINITSPAWFHVMGIVFITFILANLPTRASLTQSL